MMIAKRLTRIVTVTVDVSPAYSREWVAERFADRPINAGTLDQVCNEARKLEAMIEASQQIKVEVFQAYAALRDMEVAILKFIKGVK